MITFMESKEKTREAVEKCLDPQLWHACAGGMVQMPQVNTKVYYFPQGHAEHACGPVNFRTCPKVVPPMVPCRVAAVKYMADPETDEVYAKLRLLPLSGNDADYGNDAGVVGGGGIHEPEAQDKPASFAKTLTQSDANNGGGFRFLGIVPRPFSRGWTTRPTLRYRAYLQKMFTARRGSLGTFIGARRGGTS
ncbi:hypothetical protein S83_006083 [Arachis hypogaea]